MLSLCLSLYIKGNQKLQFTANNYILILCTDFNFDYDDCNGQGNNIKNCKLIRDIPTLWVIIVLGVCFLFLGILMSFGRISIASNIITNPIYYIIVSVLGWYFVWSLSKLISLLKEQNPQGAEPITLLIPHGRSLLKGQADDKHPRIVVAADFEQANAPAGLGLNTHGLLFLGFRSDYRFLFHL